MPHSLRAKLSGLRYKGILEDKDYKRLCKALDNKDVLDKIRAEIQHEADNNADVVEMKAMYKCLQIIDKNIKAVEE